MKDIQTQSRPIKTHIGCDTCGSSDAKTLYEDGHSFCFSCRTLVTEDKKASKGIRKKINKNLELDKVENSWYNNSIAWQRDSLSTTKELSNGVLAIGLPMLSNSSSPSSLLPPIVPLPPSSPSLVGLSSHERGLLPEENHTEGSRTAENSSWLPIHQGDPRSPRTGFLEAPEGTLGKDLTPNIAEVKKLTTKIIDNFPYRGLDKATLSWYSSRVVIDESRGGQEMIDYGYGEGVGKYRRIKDKKFWTYGKFNTDAGLFGMQRFPPGSAKAITITEGEDDAMAAYEMTGSKFPVVSVPGGVSNAATICAKHRDYLNSFDKIYICMDNDKPGQEAAANVARLFNPNKVYMVELHKHKDAMEYFEHKQAKEFVSVWYAARRFRPKGIISGYDEIAKILEAKDAEKLADYPFGTINDMSLGIRSSEVVLITAPSGIGKTEVLRAIEYKILSTTDYNIGVIHLEERERRAMMGLITYELKVPVHRPESTVSIEEKLEAYKKLTKRDDRVHYYQHFGSEDPNVILDVIRHLVTVDKCKMVFLDHITMLVTGHQGDDERKTLDYLSTALASLTRELDFTLFLVSHENAQGGTRGSANIENIADLWIRVNRDKENPDAERRNTIEVVVKKNRYGSDTGPGGLLKFDTTTYTLNEMVVPDMHKIDGGATTNASTLEGFGLLGREAPQQATN